ncbi:hypothetical protein HUW51_01370 [Adhaeribacter swui]|uniref:DUF4136 domain-containing protein n=1 Tax=Adhaeribacter swui TaxID=2086471 RepID=A0A7G7G2Q9_9BACT|nr:hypothetical protein [Adhaeribacter swui]QNF31443.1 hypothetical protein HUW51_01370 [Adhaeribacter swui]
MKNIILILILLVLFISSCAQKVTKEKSTGSTEKIEPPTRTEILQTISNQYKTNIAFDTVRYNFTYQYQELLKQNNRVVIDRFRIIDIQKTDTHFVLLLERWGYYRNLFLNLSCTENQLNHIKSNYSDYRLANSRIVSVYLIVDIDKVKKINFSNDLYGNNNREDESTTFLKLNTSDTFSFEGKVEDIYPDLKK